MSIDTVPEWMRGLEEEDVGFIRKFVLHSGSLKRMADEYGVSYPTVRLRLDRLIQKIEIDAKGAGDPYVGMVKKLALDERIDFSTAKLLIREYRKTKGDSD